MIKILRPIQRAEACSWKDGSRASAKFYFSTQGVCPVLALWRAILHHLLKRISNFDGFNVWLLNIEPHCKQYGLLTIFCNNILQIILGILSFFGFLGIWCISHWKNSSRLEQGELVLMPPGVLAFTKWCFSLTNPLYILLYFLFNKMWNLYRESRLASFKTAFAPWSGG